MYKFNHGYCRDLILHIMLKVMKYTQYYNFEEILSKNVKFIP